MRFLSISLALCCLATLPGCLPGPLGAKPSVTGKKAGKAVPVAVKALAGTVLAPASLISNNGGGLVSNGGGNLVSNNGGGLVTNGGGNFRVLAGESQVPVAHAVVRVLDASGQPIKDDKGLPIEAKTDAQGRYGFTAALPVQNLVIEVALSSSKGAVQAIVPKDSPKEAEVDCDLISSLTTGYILDQYVRSQKSPQTVLDKLPADMEEDTREKARLAFDGASAAVPDSLKQARVNETVEVLRKDPGLDEQLNAVEKLLVAAGQSDLGSGQRGTEVMIGEVRRLIPQPDGGLVFSCPSDRRVWRLEPDGVLRALAGNGTPSAISLEGLRGRGAGLDQIVGCGFDGQGRLLLLEHAKAPALTAEFSSRVVRIGANGKAEELWRTKDMVRAVWPQGDRVLALVESAESAGRVVSIRKQQEPELLKTLDGESRLLAAISDYVWDAQGRLLFKTNDPQRPDSFMLGDENDRSVFRFDPATGTMESMLAPLGEDTGRTYLNWDGSVVGNGVQALPDGTTRPAPEIPLSPWPLTDRAGNLGRAIALTNDGVLLFVQDDSKQLTSHDHAGADRNRFFIYRKTEAGDKAELLVGRDGTGEGAANALSLTRPGGALPLPDGGLLVADAGGHVIYKVGADQKATRFAGTGETSDGGDREGLLQGPTVLRTDGRDGHYVMYGTYSNQNYIAKLGAKGQLAPWFGSEFLTEPSHGVGHSVMDFVVTASGKTFVSAQKNLISTVSTNMQRIWVFEAGEKQATLLTAVETYGWLALALDRQERLFVLDPSPTSPRLMTWDGAQQGLVTVKAAEGFASVKDAATSMAIDADGRVYVADLGKNRLYRYDPATDEFTTIAGEGGTHFSGLGVDDSVDKPFYPVFDAQGNLYFSDIGHKQIKRIPANEL